MKCLSISSNNKKCFEIGYSYLHLEYDAGANTTGSIDVDLARKQTS